MLVFAFGIAWLVGCTLVLAFANFLWKSLFGGDIPNDYLYAIITIVLIVWLLDPIYRYIYAGRDRLEQPMAYSQTRAKLMTWRTVCFFVILSTIWFSLHIVSGFIWVGVEVAVTIWLDKLGQRRAYESHLRRIRQALPELSSVEHLELVDFHTKADLEEGRVI